METIETLYLSERNLRTLLSKLDRFKNGDPTHCTLVKYRGPSIEYRQSMDTVYVVAVPDDVYYPSQSRDAGEVHPLDTPKE